MMRKLRMRNSSGKSSGLVSKQWGRRRDLRLTESTARFSLLASM